MASNIMSSRMSGDSPQRPVRLQLSRRKGFNLQEHSRAINGLAAVNVARPSRWGNPFEVGKAKKCLLWDDKPIFVINVEHAVELHRQWLTYFLDNEFPGCGETKAALQNQLRGKNLACFCRGTQPCHADILLELAAR